MCRFAKPCLTAILLTVLSGCAVNGEQPQSQVLLRPVSGCDPLLPVCGLGTATLVNRQAPFYPTEAARNGIEGWVDLELRVGASGEVLDVSVIASEPEGVFDEAAAVAAAEWRFAARPDGGAYPLTPRVIFDLIN